MRQNAKNPRIRNSQRNPLLGSAFRLPKAGASALFACAAVVGAVDEAMDGRHDVGQYIAAKVDPTLSHLYMVPASVGSGIANGFVHGWKALYGAGADVQESGSQVYTSVKETLDF